MALLAHQPGIGANHQGTRLLGVRRLHLSRVGYFVHYVAGADTLGGLAFWHASRAHPAKLQRASPAAVELLSRPYGV